MSRSKSGFSMLSGFFAFALVGLSMEFAPAQILQDDSASLPSAGHIHEFQRQQLSSVYFSEGAAVGDLNNDGHPDLVYGPFWFEGPDFKRSHELYKPVAQPMLGYADHFFAWVHDFNGDGWNDILVVGFPGTPAYVYENPGTESPSPPDPLSQKGAGSNEEISQSPGNHASRHWKKHEVFDWVSNESPQWVDLTGDGKPELVCTRDSCFGYAVPEPNCFNKWTFQAISDKMAPDRFGHGLGVGDIDGDGRMDVLTKDGWFQQPSDSSKPFWDYHPFVFAAAGGADMHAYDVNGDGLNDVITSEDAHGWGLVWWEQARSEAGKISFIKHVIMGSRPSENPYGVYVSEPHSVILADLDGDGLKDIITGKTYWSHHRKSPNWDAGPMVYWFRLKRTDKGAQWIPRLVDDSAGIGRQIVAADVNRNGFLDIVTGGMLGCHVMHNSRRWAKGVEYLAAQPKPRRPLADGLTAKDAAARMTVPQGFHVQLAASEPLVHQPVAMTIDHRGRVWIAEAHNYPIRAPEGEGKDRIIILEDTTLDGQLDKKTVFIEGLNLVSGLEVGFGGVWVGAAPYLMFIPDADQDDVPDAAPVALLDGFGYQDTHETLNSFNWGPDGWLYGCHGVFTHSRVGKPGTPDEQRVALNAGIWRYHPIHHQFEVHAWGTSNPWGIDFNDYGQAFTTACVIPHLFQVIPGARYHRQAGQHFNPHTYDDIKTIADHAHYAGNIGDHAWWGHEPLIQADTSDAGGGHAHCGAMIYLGDNWPARYRNQIFFNNIHGNRVNMDRLVRQGSGYVGRHGDDLLLANDRWFRGINLRYGPDGSVYLIDWYDQNACHRVNPEIWDRSNGRVYNIAFGIPDRKRVNLESLGDVELAKLALHRNDWYVRMSRRILQHRAMSGKLDAAAVKPEINSLLMHEDETRVLRGLWLGHVTGLLSEGQLLASLVHSSPYVNAWAIQLSCETGYVSELAQERMAELARQKGMDPIVRLALASALQRMPFGERWPLMEGLLQHGSDADDQNLPLVIWYGLEPLVAHDPAKALAAFKNTQIPLLRQFFARRAAADQNALQLLLTSLSEMESADQTLVLQQLMIAFEGSVKVAMPNSWEPAYRTLSKSTENAIVDLADRLAVVFGDSRVFPNLRTILKDAHQPLAQRQRALQILVQGRDSEAAEALHAALETPELQSPAIRALAGLGNAETPKILLDGYSRLTPAAREDAIATLVSRALSAHRLLDAIDQGTIPRNDVHAYHVRQMTNLGEEELSSRIEKSWGRVASSTTQQQAQIAQYKSNLTADALASANFSHGRMLYQKHCASCHKLFGAGEIIGPDLTGSNRADLDYILENLVAPNAVVGRDYQMNILLLLDGRVVSGLITRQTESALTVKTINDLVVIAKDDIEEQQLSDMSLMPNGLLDPLTPEEVRDLIAYLGSPNQVALRGPPAPIDPETRAVPNVFEGEKLAVVEKSSGTVSSQDMRAFSADRWSGDDHLWWRGAKPGDRLTVEIEVPQSGTYELQAVMTMARDYGIVQLYWDGEKLGEPVDLFNEPQVITTGVLSLGTREISSGKHQLACEIVGTHPKAVKAYLFGLDFFRLQPAH
jgi:putative membrane-bound dehydrogenase-like protein